MKVPRKMDIGLFDHHEHDDHDTDESHDSHSNDEANPDEMGDLNIG